MKKKLKISKKELIELRALAYKLPNTYQDGVEEREIYGRSLISRGICIVKGKAVDPDKKYVFPLKEKLPVNHFRRMKAIYEQTKSVPELKKYCDGVMQLVKDSHKPLNADHFKPLLNA